MVLLPKWLFKGLCSRCEGTGEDGTDDMGTPVVCENCAGTGRIEVFTSPSRDPVLWREK